jgi:hypothetical protein
MAAAIFEAFLGTFRRQAYEAERNRQYNQCKRDLRNGAWTAISGSPAQGIAQMGTAYTGQNCQPGPYKPPSQTPAPPPPPPRPATPPLRLQEPGPLTWNGS